MDTDPGARPAPGAILDPEELAQLATEVLSRSPLPALVLGMPSANIVAASPSAIQLLSPEGGKVLGRLLNDFTVDQSSIASDLFAGGQLNGIETSRTLRRRSGAEQPIRMWIRQFDRQPTSRFVLAVLVTDNLAGVTLTEPEWSLAPTVVGTTNASLLIERISRDAEDLFGQSVPELVGRSLLAVLDVAAVPAFLGALSDAFTSRHGVTLDVDIRSAAGPLTLAERRICELLIIPLEPSPSCAFVFLPMPLGIPRSKLGTDLRGMLLRLGQGAEVARLAGGTLTRVATGAIPGMEKLTTRELQILAPLLDGDRPPAIASKLFLSQKTVRNHLSSIYAKLGVASQQDLLNVFRCATV